MAIAFVFLIRGRNCEKTIEKCIRSIRRQTYTHWKAIISLDAPVDNAIAVTEAVIKDDERFKLAVNKNNYGVCKNMYLIIREARLAFNPNGDTVTVIVDADDYISRKALSTVEHVYRKHPDTLITHGSYRKMSKSKRTKISNAYPKGGNVKKLPWRGSHLKTIKWKIIKHARPQWFQHDGKWLEAASDLALMFGCIGRAGLNRVRHVHKVIYYWNDHVTRRKIRLQRKCEKLLRKG